MNGNGTPIAFCTQCRANVYDSPTNYCRVMGHKIIQLSANRLRWRTEVEQARELERVDRYHHWRERVR